MNNKTLRERLLIWRTKNIKERYFLLVLSFVVGILSGVAAVILKNAIHHFSHFLTRDLTIESHNYQFLIYPVIGIFLTFLFVKFFVKADITHGVSKILHAISKKDGKIEPHNTFSSLIASTLTIAFGGSLGSEGPIALTGAAMGSNLGRFFNMSYKNLTVLIGCGAAGGIAGIFNAPIAGVVFTLEVLMLNLTKESIAPLLIAAVTATSVSYFFMGEAVLFSNATPEPFFLETIPYYILLGVVAGFVSLYCKKGVIRIEEKMNVIKNPYLRLFGGGLLLGLLIFIFPPVLGEGYDVVHALLDNRVDTVVHNSLFYFFKDSFWLLLCYTIIVILLKFSAAALTTSSGGVGGAFAPTLFLGAATGGVMAFILNEFHVIEASQSNFALVGMAGLMAGVMHAPLTAIFLVTEITNGYDLIVPLMITSTIAYIITTYSEPHSVYTKRLAKRDD